MADGGTPYEDNTHELRQVEVCLELVRADLLDRGVSLRAAASALGISHSTLEYQVKKFRGEV